MEGKEHFMKRSYKLDGGYGLIDNTIIYDLLNIMLDEDNAKTYREKLVKENKEAYEEYLEFENNLKQIENG